ncbi:MAG: gamma-glutamyl-gamma-aminobutyrate hydrolase [Candidatus Wallbacteria bacterium HGW-Wallbacteria-1]|uniref:Gamma-glutamyl-gamma-aminobutyrate hydrolase n=1 Tax=Candidatus Wallbacteria bacterium HGW-Wallbacteria-1 TaxID=2013854 RepID=A0A2N1PUL8_9BACT|nr:MAG: gamma-glutamyl-gamma-aminobutyrate hydrolase [Candidatus Wallbacteria bacterium HGW-Wallbacteria-1]
MAIKTSFGRGVSVNATFEKSVSEKGSADVRFRPLIGVNMYYREPVGDWRRGQSFLRDEYSDAIRGAGGIPVLFPPCDDREEMRCWIDAMDGILLVGGEDVDPRRYGQSARPETEILPEVRERSDFALARLLLDDFPLKPVLGICGGMQLINVVLGGTLIQHIPAQIESPLIHRAEDDRKQWAVHLIEILPDSRLFAIADKGLPVSGNFETNSFHHQCLDRLGRGLKVSALSSDGVVEAVESDDSIRGFLLGVQWHPEYLMTPDLDMGLFRSLVSAAEESGK